MLAEGRLSQEPVDQLFVGIGALVGNEDIHFFHRRWQSGQIQRQATDERVAIRLLVVQPDKRLIAEISDYFKEDASAFKKRLSANLSVLHSQLQEKYPSQVELRTIHFRPSFGYAACDPDSATGFIRVESYTCHSSQVTRPMMQFKRQNRPSEFALYLDDLNNIWDAASKYTGP